MYQYKGAYGKRRGPGQKWANVDVDETPLKTLFLEFYRLYIFVDHPHYDGIHHFVIDEIPDYLYPRTEQRPLKEWLSQLGNVGLPLNEGRIQYEQVTAPYVDAWRAGCHIRPVHPTYHPDQPITRSEKTDLLISHDTITSETMIKRWLITVNGFFHYAGYTDKGLQVIGGGLSQQLCNENLVGIWDLGTLGEIETYPIKDHHIANSNLEPYRKRLWLKLDDAIDIENKTVFLVIGGIFHYSPHYVRPAGERLWEVNFRDYPLPHHFFDLKAQTNLEGMTAHHDSSTANPNQVSVQQLYSDESIKGLLTHYTSFFVVVNTPEVSYELIRTESTRLPGVVKSPEDPIWPLKQRLGRFVEYWTRREADMVKFFYSERYEYYYAFETTNWKNFNSLDSSRVPDRRYDFALSYLLKLSSFRENT